jgi:hypothetical protein
MVLVLITQLVLTLFAPPIPLGSRSLFLGDLWILFWAPCAVGAFWKRTSNENRRSVKLMLACAAFVILTAWLHGHWRSELLAPLLKAGMATTEFDTFNPFREGVIGLRFFSWIIAGTAVALWLKASTKEEHQIAIVQIGRAFNFLIVLCGAIMTIEWCSFSVQTALSSLYHYGTLDSSDLGRIQGSFSSPNEAGLCLVFSGLLLSTMSTLSDKRQLTKTIVGLYSALVSILSRSATPIIAAGLSFLGFFLTRSRRATSLMFIASVITLGVICTSASGFIAPILHQKFGHLGGRLGPWLVYINVALQRWDVLLFGTGFNSFYVDNLFIFIFNRTGLLGFSTALVFLAKWIKNSWQYWNSFQRTVVTFSLISSLTLDTFILRTFATIWITVAIPTLLSRERAVS